MEIEELIRIVNLDFYTGVPDSLLRPLCDYLIKKYGTNPAHHVIAANEGNCTAIGAGYYLASGRVPVVYMQNSGEGNMINPAASLLHPEVYAVPMLFIVGWRGEPGVYDEPQHIYQGKITGKLLDDLGIETFIIRRDSGRQEVEEAMKKFRHVFDMGGQAAFIICKDALIYKEEVHYKNGYQMVREDIIRHIVSVSGKDPIVSTTGKASRELYEIREQMGTGHDKDFLTVGSMGHSSSIALGIALQKQAARIWCIDGDGAVLMHMGSMAVIGSTSPDNLIHIVINNESHETVGGMPTAAKTTDLVLAARACGYLYAARADTFEQLDRELNRIKMQKGPCFLEVKCAMGARRNLGRPTIGTQENKKRFMDYLKSEEI